MATCLDIITGAILELGARALGDTLAAEESTRGLAVLQAMYMEAIEQGHLGRVEEYLATDDYEAEEGQRVFAAGFTITLPDTIEDECEDDTRKPRDLAMIQVVDEGEEPEISVYDARLGAWVRWDSLTLTDTAPLSGRNRHGLECALARRLAATFQRPIPESTAAYSNGLGSVLNNRLQAPATTIVVEYL